MTTNPNRTRRGGRFWPRGAKQARDTFLEGTSEMDTDLEAIRARLDELTEYLQAIDRANQANARDTIDRALERARSAVSDVRIDLVDLQLLSVRLHTEMVSIQQEYYEEEGETA